MCLSHFGLFIIVSSFMKELAKRKYLKHAKRNTYDCLIKRFKWDKHKVNLLSGANPLINLIYFLKAARHELYD